MDCLGCDLSTVMPDGSIYCVALDMVVHAEDACEFWSSGLLSELEEYAQEEE